MSTTTRPPRRQLRRPGAPRRTAHKVKVTADQEAELTRRAAARNVTVSRFLVESALRDEPPPTVVDAVTAEAMAELFGLTRLLSRVSTNVNQIARATNATGELQATTVTALDAITRVCRRIEVWIAAAGGR
jgi:hypothetical protein